MDKKKTLRGNTAKKKLGKLIVTLLLLAVAYIFANYIEPSLSDDNIIPTEGTMQVHFIDVGQGDASLIVTPNGKHILIDAGPNSAETALEAYLERYHVKSIELMILSHPHEDHIGGADRILTDFHVEHVLLSQTPTTTHTYEKMLDAIDASGATLELALPEAVYEIDGVKVTILGPEHGDANNLNNDSIICRVDFGSARMIFSGDAEKSSEEALLTTYSTKELDCDLFKLGHHGSHTSNTEAFIDAMSPKYAIASCGAGNDYGHPHSEVRELLEEREIPLLRTDKDGSIVFVCDGIDFVYIAN